MVNFQRAIEWLKSGGKVRRPSWKEDSYWKLGVDESIQWTDGTHAHIHLDQIYATDFEIYEESQALKKINPEFTGKQLDAIKQIQKILLGFGCNTEVKLEGRCPFGIGSCIHKYSPGCLHYKLYNILKKYGRL